MFSHARVKKLLVSLIQETFLHVIGKLIMRVIIGEDKVKMHFY